MFVDSSVFVAATFSSTGGSFRFFIEAAAGALDLLTSTYVVAEVEEVLRRKRPDALPHFRETISRSRASIKRSPQSRTVLKYARLIHPEDAPILAGAVTAKAQYLITLDRRDFMTAHLRRTRPPVQILTPGDFWQQYWK